MGFPGWDISLTSMATGCGGASFHQQTNRRRTNAQVKLQQLELLLKQELTTWSPPPASTARYRHLLLGGGALSIGLGVAHGLIDREHHHSGFSGGCQCVGLEESRLPYVRLERVAHVVVVDVDAKPAATCGTKTHERMSIVCACVQVIVKQTGVFCVHLWRVWHAAR